MLKEIIFYGRGGQGGVTAANLLASAALKSGNKGVQAFPFFGAERRGAPVKAFARISDEEIYLRSQIREPDVVVVLDTGIMDVVNVMEGLREDGIVLLNTPRKPSEVDMPCRVATVDATTIAINNKIMVGALAKILEGVKIDAVKEAIMERFGRHGEANASAAEQAYNEVML